MYSGSIINKLWVFILLFGFCFMCFLVCADSLAQSATEETLSISDSVGYEIDKSENAKYKLFPEYGNLILAEFLKRGNELFLRISYEKGGKRLTDTLSLSKEQFESYKKKIRDTDTATTTEKQQKTITEAQKEGRKRLVTDAVFYGLSLYGPGTAILLDMQDLQSSGLEFLAGGGAFMAALNATKDYKLGYGRSKLLRSGCYAGTLYGLGIPVFFESDNEKAYWGSAMLCTPIGGILGYKLSSHRWFEKGEADMITNGGVTGGLYGLSIPYLINIDDLKDETQAKIYVASAMAGIPVGVYTMSKLIHNKNISQGRANLITSGGTLGTLYSVGTLYVAGLDFDKHSRIYVLASALSLPASAYFSYKYTSKEEYTMGRALLIDAGTYAGALLACGFVLMLEEDTGKPYVTAAMLGSLFGTWYSHRLTRGWGENINFALNNHIPDNIKVSLPSCDELLTFGILALSKPKLDEDRKIALLKVIF